MVVAAASFLAIDWGTTNRRIYAIDRDGQVLDTERDDRGVLAMQRGGFAPEIAGVRARFGDLPILCAGMVGSTRGWVDVPYLDCPADITALAANLHWIELGRTAIVPGLAFRDTKRPDVMRGEEVQLLGAIGAGSVPRDALLCQPGTHCKWASIVAGRVDSFRTAITGELFALLRRHSLFAEFLDGAVTDGGDFQAGLELSRSGPLLERLFSERAGVLLGVTDKAAVAARVSGLLIGCDVAAQRLAKGNSVYLLADDALADLYAAAITAVGARPHRISSRDSFVAGITAIWRSCQ